MISFAKCWTGRRWINIGSGWLAIGFGPTFLFERVMWRGKLVIVNGRRLAKAAA
jgi:hypothetical protein